MSITGREAHRVLLWRLATGNSKGDGLDADS